MPYSTYINIGNVIIRIGSRRLPEKNLFEIRRYDDFILKERPDHVDIDINLTMRSQYKLFEHIKLFDVKTNIPKLRELENNLLSQREKQYLGKNMGWRVGKCGNKVLLEGGVLSRYQLIMNNNLRRGKAFIITSDAQWTVSGIIYGFLEPLLIYYLAKHSLGIIGHGAGVKDGKNGYLFLGLTGSGKSTIYMLWSRARGAKVLNDDKVVVRKENGVFFMYATPWHSYMVGQDGPLIMRSRLTRIFHICHSKINQARRLVPAEAFTLFSKTIFFPIWDKSCVKFSYFFLSDMLSVFIPYNFGFKKDGSTISYIRKLCDGMHHGETS